MSKKPEYDCIAFCGLDCEKCDAYIATVNDDQALREKTAKLWAEANQAPITAEMINCLGCRGDGVKTPYCAGMCEIRKCAVKKGLASCALCGEMKTCDELKPVLDNSEEARSNLLK